MLIDGLDDSVEASSFAIEAGRRIGLGPAHAWLLDKGVGAIFALPDATPGKASVVQWFDQNLGPVCRKGGEMPRDDCGYLALVKKYRILIANHGRWRTKAQVEAFGRVRAAIRDGYASWRVVADHLGRLPYFDIQTRGIVATGGPVAGAIQGMGVEPVTVTVAAIVAGSTLLSVAVLLLSLAAATAAAAFLLGQLRGNPLATLAVIAVAAAPVVIAYYEHRKARARGGENRENAISVSGFLAEIGVGP